MPDAVGNGVAEVVVVVVEDWLPVGVLAVLEDDDGALYEPSDHTESREPPPQNSVLSLLQIDEQFPCSTFSVLIVLPQ